MEGGQRIATLTAAEHHFAVDTGDTDGLAIALMRVSWPTDGCAIRFEHRLLHLQPGRDRELHQLGTSIDEENQ